MQANSEMPRTILVVDDFDDTRLLLRTWLEKRGFRVVEAANGLDAVARAESDSPDLIIMDVSLSNSEWDGERVDGLEITRRLKRDPDAGRVPILLATAHAMKGSREAFLRASGADDYISKPIVSADELIERIQALLGKRNDAISPPPR